jgi:hypothetical protein
LQYPHHVYHLFVGLIAIPTLGTNEYFIFFYYQYSYSLDNDVIFVTVETTFHEGDHGKVPTKHAMEGANGQKHGWVVQNGIKSP